MVPKNAPDKDGAYAYLDAMLDKSAQEAFAVDMGYNPTVTNAVVAPDLNKRIGFTPEEIKKLVDLDYSLHEQERHRVQGMVGQGAEELSGMTTNPGMAKPPMAATAAAQFQSEKRPTSVLSATTLVGPATVFVAAGLLVPLAILLRYSFNTMDPRRIMHGDVLARQLRQVFRRSLLHRRAVDHVARGGTLHRSSAS